jgi:putative ABC transport system substrate-binding protein
MRRRDFISGIGSAAALPVVAQGQQSALPVIGFVNGAAADASASYGAAFRKGLGEAGFIEGQNVIVEYHWLDGRYGGLAGLMADLVRRRVDVIATPVSNAASLAAKAATSTIPIVFGVGQDPVQLGLVASLSRPGGNATGVNTFGADMVAKRLALLHDLAPRAVRIAVLVNPGNANIADATLQHLRNAAGTMGLQIHVLNAATSSEIDAAFVTIGQEQLQALFVGPDAYFVSRRVQLATLTARDRIPAAFADRAIVEAGGLMNYNVNVADSFRQVGVYAGNILKGAKPAELPVAQPTKFEFILNLQTAKLLRIEVSPALLALADEVIE